MSKIRVPTLEDASKDYRDNRRDRQRLAKEKRDIQSQAAKESHGGMYGLSDSLTRRGRQVSLDVRALAMNQPGLKSEAASIARNALYANTDFRALIVGVVNAVFERVEPFVSYKDVQRRAPFAIQSLPIAIDDEVSGLIKWARELQRCDLIALDDLPPVLREFMEASA